MEDIDMQYDDGDMEMITVHWFRRGLRLHDNPALHDAVRNSKQFYPIFIFDGETAGTKIICYNRMRFILESLHDLDRQFRASGGRLYVFNGSPIEIFQKLKQKLGVNRICFEQDSEPIWQPRDEAVKELCKQEGIECIEHISHTLWNPHEVIKTNGGVPPLTYQMFLHTVSAIGQPPRPVSDILWEGVKFGQISSGLISDLQIFDKIPTPEILGIFPEPTLGERMVRWEGGEHKALALLKERINVETNAFKEGYYLPNQARPDLLGRPTSLSAFLSIGCLSVRRFYWTIHDIFKEVHGNFLPHNEYITGQLIWREYFYTMSVNNPYYGEMEKNPICLNISWKKEYKRDLEKWSNGKTGFPFIDAVMRQLRQEGWVHHVARNAVATFLTRGDLWITWEEGLQHFLNYLVDADWSVCAGNWMWVSSSAFEQLLDCTHCVCPVNFGRRLDPWGEYIRRYVPELQNYPTEYIYEPWKASIEDQEKAGCIIGRDYPERMVKHQQASMRNKNMMMDIRNSLMRAPPHCCPSNVEEVRQFMWFPESCNDHLSVSAN
uniref:Cryptochrome-1 n=1 Tax=Clastoptera arizonana TaxID=38151 RepID=A0A1B6CJU7_9HEMI